MKNSGRFYHEVCLGEGIDNGDPQIGWLTEHFSVGEFDGSGVGDDVHGWAVDGVRHNVWHCGPKAVTYWQRDWREGDVLGCAVDIDAGQMAFAVNGQWLNDARMSFDSAGSSLFPAISARGDFTMHVAETTWHFIPPADDYRGWADDGDFSRPRSHTQPQGWHRDVEVLWPYSAVGGPLPPYCVNIFVPLVDIDCSNGATEFLPGSHLLDVEADADLSGKVQPRVPAGTAMLFDCRLSHRGGANYSRGDRTVLYFAYAMPWFRDPGNHLSTRLLFASEAVDKETQAISDMPLWVGN